MKTILAMALVGLLSISSLAEEAGLGVPPTEPDEPESVQPYPSFAELKCHDKYTKIEYEAGGDFCIQNRASKNWFFDNALDSCKSEVRDNKITHLCSQEEWTLACKQVGSELKMSKENGGEPEWVQNNNKPLVKGIYGCESITNRNLIDDKNKSKNSFRCCYSMRSKVKN
jgi:hypothetical protein